jgi:hypothetical protein
MSFSDVSSLTMRLSSGDRPVFLPEYAVRAPLSVIAVPVSYTWSRCQLDAPGRVSGASGTYQCVLVESGDGGVGNLVTGCQLRDFHLSNRVAVTHDGNAVIVDVGLLVKFLLKLGVLHGGSWKGVSSWSLKSREKLLTAHHRDGGRFC